MIVATHDARAGGAVADAALTLSVSAAVLPGRVRRSPSSRWPSLLAWRLRLGLARELAIAALRATVQLAAVGALIALVFRVEPLAIAFVGGDGRHRGAHLRRAARGRSAARAPGRSAAIGLPALGAAAILIAVGAFAATPRAAIPTAGILIGGAMTATTLTGRRLLEGLEADEDAIETRLALGDRLREALAPTVRQAITTGLVPAIDQTRNVGLVTLPGTFVGLVLGGASPARGGARPADRPAHAAGRRAAQRDRDRRADRAHADGPGRAPAVKVLIVTADIGAGHDLPGPADRGRRSVTGARSW